MCEGGIYPCLYAFASIHYIKQAESLRITDNAKLLLAMLRTRQVHAYDAAFLLCKNTKFMLTMPRFYFVKTP
jgi:hypothetical protein